MLFIIYRHFVEEKSPDAVHASIPCQVKVDQATGRNHWTCVPIPLIKPMVPRCSLTLPLLPYSSITPYSSIAPLLFHWSLTLPLPLYSFIAPLLFHCSLALPLLPYSIPMLPYSSIVPLLFLFSLYLVLFTKCVWLYHKSSIYILHTGITLKSDQVHSTTVYDKDFWAFLYIHSGILLIIEE